MTHYSNTGNPIDFPKLSTIDKLWGQALDRVVPDTYSSLSLTQVEKVKTVFAELIVRECVRYFNEDYERDFETLWREDLSKGIKEHFGIRE